MFFGNGGLAGYVATEISTEEEGEKFAEFAFGKDFRDISGIFKFAERWNEKHGNEYRIDMSNLIPNDIKIMVKIWRDSISPREIP